VVIDDLDYLDRLDCTPIQAAVCLRRPWIRGRPENEPLSIRKLQGELTVSLAIQLMASTRQVSKVLKTARCFQVSESGCDPLRARNPMLLLERSLLFTSLLQPSFCERDLQGRYFRFLSTHQVYNFASDTKSLN
jgi:hypothetical protein